MLMSGVLNEGQLAARPLTWPLLLSGPPLRPPPTSLPKASAANQTAFNPAPEQQAKAHGQLCRCEKPLFMIGGSDVLGNRCLRWSSLLATRWTTSTVNLTAQLARLHLVHSCTIALSRRWLAALHVGTLHTNHQESFPQTHWSPPSPAAHVLFCSRAPELNSRTSLDSHAFQAMRQPCPSRSYCQQAYQLFPAEI
jgi:hypothetical protein